MRSVGRCVAFRSCRRHVKYWSPANLCSKHWRMWWDYGVRGVDLPYMTKLNRRDDTGDCFEIWLKEGSR